MSFQECFPDKYDRVAIRIDLLPVGKQGESLNHGRLSGQEAEIDLVFIKELIGIGLRHSPASPNFSKTPDHSKRSARPSIKSRCWGRGPDRIATIYIVVEHRALQMILLDKFDSLDGACLLPPVFVSSACWEMQKKRWRAALAIRIALSQCGSLVES